MSQGRPGRRPVTPKASRGCEAFTGKAACARGGRASIIARGDGAHPARVAEARSSVTVSICAAPVRAMVYALTTTSPNTARTSVRDILDPARVPAQAGRRARPSLITRVRRKACALGKDRGLLRARSWHSMREVGVDLPACWTNQWSSPSMKAGYDQHDAVWRSAAALANGTCAMRPEAALAGERDLRITRICACSMPARRILRASSMHGMRRSMLEPDARDMPASEALPNASVSSPICEHRLPARGPI